MHEILAAAPQGLSEYELLNALREQFAEFQTDRSVPLALFRQHFILFHALYRLQAELLSRQQATLQISPQRIALSAYLNRDTGDLTQADPLRSYYMDLTQLQSTGTEEVESLLDAFWENLGRSSQRQEALRILGLSEPVDAAGVRRRYRELVMRHHPDRGGDTAGLQLINAALAVLLPGRRSTRSHNE